MKTISELNSKWWYRLVKVIYSLFFIGFTLGLIFVIFETYAPRYDNNSSYLKCANGKQFILGKNGIFLSSDYLDYWDTEKAKNLCFEGTVKYEKNGSGNTFFDNVLTPKVTFVSDVSGKYELVSFYAKRDWPLVIFYSLLAFLGTALFFEIVRRVFYYVVLGSLKPKK